MGIYIKGMEMPKSCAKCKLFGEYGCPFIGAVGYALTRGERNEDCPLVPVPPHGRLGDLDELKAKIKKEDNAYGFDSYGDGMHDAFQSIYQCIDAAPTIIPAEEETYGRR